MTLLILAVLATKFLFNLWFPFTTARKNGNILLTYLKKLFSSDTHQSMKTSDSDLRVNRNIYTDAVTCDMRLIGPKSGQLGPINHVAASVNC